jgi:hypothetical protein
MYELRIVRERVGYGRQRRVKDSQDVYQAFREHFAALDQEQFNSSPSIYAQFWAFFDGLIGGGSLRKERRVAVNSSPRPGTYREPSRMRATTRLKVKEPLVFYGVPTRAGDRGRTGDVQLGKLSRPLWSNGFSAAVAELG